MNQKKLFIIGAGASKDYNSTILLGKDVIIKIKNLKQHIYYELIFLVITKIYRVHFGKTVALSHGISRIIDDYVALKYDFKCGDENNKKHIKGFINKLAEFVLNYGNGFSKSDLSIIVNETLNILFDPETQPFTVLTSYLPFKYYTKEYKNWVSPTVWLEQTDIIIDFIFKELDWKPEANPTQNNFIKLQASNLKQIFKDYVINGIILSVIIDDFNEEIHSIDHIINFLPSVSFYNDDYAKQFGLPNIEQLSSFAKKHVAMIIEKSIDSNTEPNWIQVVQKHLFFNKKQKLEDIDFINFNYDFLLEDHFASMKNTYNDKDLQDKIESIIDKIKNTHIYGKIEKRLAETLTTIICANLHWFCGLFVLKTSQIQGDEKTEIVNTSQEKTKESIAKIKTFIENYNNISFIREFNDTEINKQFNKIKEMDNIYIFGFGFDDWNLRNIGLYDDNFCIKKEAFDIKNKNIYVTNYSDLPKIRLILERIFGVEMYKDSENIYNDKKYSFWRSKNNNDRNNNVFISTKSVYKALTEDFVI